MKLSPFSKQENLKLSPLKSQAIIFNSSIKLHPPFTIDNITLPYLLSVKNFGLDLGKNMTWDPHIAYINIKFQRANKIFQNILYPQVTVLRIKYYFIKPFPGLNCFTPAPYAD